MKPILGRKGSSLALVPMIVLTLSSSALADGFGYSCYRYVTEHRNGIDFDDLTKACEKIHTSYALGCVEISIDHVVGDDVDRIESCSRINSVDALECVVDAYDQYAIPSQERIKACGQW
jgi:hypothetical protein